MSENGSGYLEVGTNDDHEIVIDLPRDMTGHIMIFSVSQARELAHALIAKAKIAEDEIAIAALKVLRIDANRLCDRNLGGMYEEDCRRAIATANAAIAKVENHS